MKKIFVKITLGSLLIIQIPLLLSCDTKEKEKTDPLEELLAIENNELQFRATLEKHLAAVSQRDLETLQSTLSPNGNMQLILPGTEIIDKVDGFMQYHIDWFAVPDWTFESKILTIEVGETIGMAIVEALYKEPERDGHPYFNRMAVSYDLQKVDGQWYVVKDHASSVEKTTDIKNE